MKLLDYIKLVPDGEEITVFDKEYDVETYFYGNVINLKAEDIYS